MKNNDQVPFFGSGIDICGEKTDVFIFAFSFIRRGEKHRKSKKPNLIRLKPGKMFR
jgi:hypothetical protein